MPLLLNKSSMSHLGMSKHDAWRFSEPAGPHNTHPTLITSHPLSLQYYWLSMSIFPSFALSITYKELGVRHSATNYIPMTAQVPSLVDSTQYPMSSCSCQSSSISPRSIYIRLLPPETSPFFITNSLGYRPKNSQLVKHLRNAMVFVFRRVEQYHYHPSSSIVHGTNMSKPRCWI